jgi:type II secretory ATPase GspE/PulE/Tfp pilus assembly ATPase PilB-like protein
MSDKLGDMLLQAKLITNEQLASALDYQKAIGGKLGVILVKLNFIREDKLAQFLSEQQNIPIVRLKDHKLDAALMKLVPRDFAEKHEIVPVSRESDTLTVVTADPMDYPAIDELAFTTGLKIQTVLAPRSEVTKALQTFYYGEKPDKKGPLAAAKAKPPAPVTDTPLSRPPTPASAAPAGGAAAKRGRASHVHSTAVDHSVPLEAKPIDVSPDKLARALAGLLVEKDVITLSELMDRVARES